MNKEQLSQRIGNMDDRLVAQAEHMPNYGRQRRSGLRRKIAGIAAVIVLISLAAKGRLLCGSPIEKLNENRD